MKEVLRSLAQQLDVEIGYCNGASGNTVAKAIAALQDAASCLESLEKDAARYRLASEQDNFCDFVIHAFGCYCDDKAGADRVIDTAMQANKGG